VKIAKLRYYDELAGNVPRCKSNQKCGRTSKWSLKESLYVEAVLFQIKKIWRFLPIE